MIGLDALAGDFAADWKESGGTVASTPQVDVDAKKLAERVRQMNRLKNATVSIAQTLVQGGLGALDDAARTVWLSRNVPSIWHLHPYLFVANQVKNRLVPPQKTARQNVWWKLKWHRDEIAKMSETPNASYSHADDLKRWVVAAFVEKNVADDEAAYVDGIWSDMWREIGENVAEVARRIGDAAKAPFIAAEKLLNMPGYVWAIIGTVVLGGAAIVGYKLIAPAASVTIARYLPGRR